jgi:hypothetical protein
MSETKKHYVIGCDGIVKQVELLCEKHPEGKNVGDTNCDCLDGDNTFLNATIRLLEKILMPFKIHEQIDFVVKIKYINILLSVDLHKNCYCNYGNVFQFYEIPNDCHLVTSLLGQIIVSLETSDKLEALMETIVSILFVLCEISIFNGSDYVFVNNFYLYISMCVFAYTHMKRLISSHCKFPTQAGLLKYMKDSSTLKYDFNIFQKNILEKINSFKKEKELKELAENNKQLEAERIESEYLETARESLNFLRQLI